MCRAHGAGLLHALRSGQPALARLARRACAAATKSTACRAFASIPTTTAMRLDHPSFAELLDEAARRKLIVQVALKMQDERTLHPLLKGLPTTDPAPLIDRLAGPTRPPVVLLNALGNLRGEPLKKLLATGGTWVDIAMLEGAAGLERLIAEVGSERLLFGSHAPLFYAESAHLKLKESVLTPSKPRRSARETPGVWEPWRRCAGRRVTLARAGHTVESRVLCHSQRMVKNRKLRERAGELRTQGCVDEYHGAVSIL